MSKEELRENIKEILESDSNILIDSVYELNSWDGSFDNLYYWNNDEEFFECFFNGNCYELAEKLHYSHDYNFTDEFVRINDLGYLVSKDWCDVIEDMHCEIDEIIDNLIEKVSYLSIDQQLENAIYEYIECEQE